MISGAEAILLVTDGNQVVRARGIVVIIIIYCTQDHTREYFMDKFTTRYCTLPIHTVAYQCQDDDRLACYNNCLYMTVIFKDSTLC